MTNHWLVWLAALASPAVASGSGTSNAASPARGAVTSPNATRPACADGRRKIECEEIAAMAAQRQADNSDWQTFIGLIGSVGLLVSLGFTYRATRLASRAATEAAEGAKAARDTLAETKAMNAAIVRPRVAIEQATIEFDIGNGCIPTIRLVTRNASDFTAHDWEWRPRLRYRIRGSEHDRRSGAVFWNARGVAGLDLAPGDHGPRIPVVVQMPLDQAEQAAATDNPDGALLIDLTAHCRFYDAFGGEILETYHFGASVHNLFQAILANGANPSIQLERMPAGPAVAE